MLQAATVSRTAAARSSSLHAVRTSSVMTASTPSSAAHCRSARRLTVHSATARPSRCASLHRLRGRAGRRPAGGAPRRARPRVHAARPRRPAPSLLAEQRGAHGEVGAGRADHREQVGVEGRDGDVGGAGGGAQDVGQGVRGRAPRRRRRSPAWPPRRAGSPVGSSLRGGEHVGQRRERRRRQRVEQVVRADQRAVRGEPHVDLDAVGTPEQRLGHRGHGVLRAVRAHGTRGARRPAPGRRCRPEGRKGVEVEQP